MAEVEGRRMRLSELARTGGRGTIAVPMINGFNMGNSTLNITMPLETFRQLSVVANEARIREVGGSLSDVAQRPLDKNHAKDLALYILRGLLASVKNRWIAEESHIPDELNDFLADLGVGPYQALQPFTANLKDCSPADLDVEQLQHAIVLHLHQAQRFRVIDGQHRRQASEIVSVWLQRLMTDGSYPTIRAGGLIVPEREDMHLTREEAEIWSAVATEASVHLTVDVTVHLGLNATQERQLFHDLNNLGKKPPAALSVTFDQANPISVFTREVLEVENRLGGLNVVDSGTKKSGRDREEKSIYRDDLTSICSILFAGATNPAGIMPSEVNKNYDLGRKFFEVITTQPHFVEPGWQAKTLLAQPTMLKGLAQLVYTFHGSREANLSKRDDLLEALQARQVDFSPANKLWHAYSMSSQEREEGFPGLEDYITPDGLRKGFVRSWHEPTSSFQFATNTRDVMRYIGDLVRWQLRDLNLGIRPGLISLKKDRAEKVEVRAA